MARSAATLSRTRNSDNRWREHIDQFDISQSGHSEGGYVFFCDFQTVLHENSRRFESSEDPLEQPLWNPWPIEESPDADEANSERKTSRSPVLHRRELQILWDTNPGLRSHPLKLWMICESGVILTTPILNILEGLIKGGLKRYIITVPCGRLGCSMPYDLVVEKRAL